MANGIYTEIKKRIAMAEGGTVFVIFSKNICLQIRKQWRMLFPEIFIGQLLHVEMLH